MYDCVYDCGGEDQLERAHAASGAATQTAKSVRNAPILEKPYRPRQRNVNGAQ